MTQSSLHAEAFNPSEGIDHLTEGSDQPSAFSGIDLLSEGRNLSSGGNGTGGDNLADLKLVNDPLEGQTLLAQADLANHYRRNGFRPDVDRESFRAVIRAVGEVFNRLDQLKNVLGGNKGMKAEDFKPITGKDGKVLSSKASSWGLFAPDLTFNIDRKDVEIPIKLPGFDGDKVNFVTDGHHLLAIDPANKDAWILNVHRNPIFSDSYSWKKLSK